MTFYHSFFLQIIKYQFLMKKLKYLFCLLWAILALNTEGDAQAAINTTGNPPDTKAMLDITSTTKGFLMPRMSAADRDAIPLPVPQGLLVYVTDVNNGSLWQYKSTGGWTEVGAATTPSVWTTSTTTPTTIYTDKTKVGINNNDPKAALHVNGQVAINSDVSTPSDKAMLDVKSTTKGTHITRMTTAQRIAIAPNPNDAGMLVFDLDKNRLYMFDGQNWLPFATADINETILTNRSASDAAGSVDIFGNSVSISGDYAIVGAPGKTGSYSRQGKAYIFYRSGSAWTQQAQLTAFDGAPFDYFGKSVSLSGDYAIVGAYGKSIGDNGNQGKAYIYYRSGSTWTLHGQLTASDGAPGDLFGNSVSISGFYAIVGATGKTIGSNTNQGKAYTYFFNGSAWTPQTQLTAPDGATYDNFGYSVSLSGDYAIVGAPSKTLSGTSSTGKAYIFGRIGASWIQVLQLTAFDQTDIYNNYNFGSSVALSGNYALVGASNISPGLVYPSNSPPGRAYIFYNNAGTWQPLRVLSANVSLNEHFGSSVSLSGDYAIVGASSKYEGTNIYQGAAYIFKKDSGNYWNQVKKLTNTNSPQRDANFGISVGITPNACIIGEHRGINATTGATTGAIHFGVIDF
jgi:FG-GAP repeat